jgi:putative alpha-1,2-mannosidase
LKASLTTISDSELSGYRFSQAWAKDQRLFFSIKTSHPFKEVLESSPKNGLSANQKMALTFINPKNEPVFIKIGISAVDVEGAKKEFKPGNWKQVF